MRHVDRPPFNQSGNEMPKLKFVTAGKPAACAALGKVAAAGLLALSASAQATVLVELVNQPVTAVAAATFTFVATDANTVISFSAYNPINHFYFDEYDGVYYPDYSAPGDSSEISGIYLKQAGTSVNLMTGSWAYSSVAFNPYSYRFADGNPAGGIVFQGDDYETYSQSFALTVGRTYQLSFGYYIGNDGANGLKVEGNVDLPSAVPEPEVLGMLLAGLGVVGALSRRQRAAKQVA